MSQPVIKAESIVRKFDERSVLNRLDMQLMPGEFCAITGKSGVGKSTLLGILGTLDLNFGGKLEIRGSNVANCSHTELSTLRRNYLGFIFQDFHLLPNLPAIDNIILPAVFSGTDTGEVRKSAEAVMERLSLRNDQTPSRFLSRGERQRVASARALVNDPEILLADEPTASLDEESESSLFDLLDSLRKEKGLAMIAVVHSKRVLSRADRILQLRDGVLHETNA